MTLIENILNSDLTEDNRRIIINNIYEASFIRDSSQRQPRLRTPKNAISSLFDVYDRIREAINHYHTRGGSNIKFTLINPDTDILSVAVDNIPSAATQDLEYGPFDNPDPPHYIVSASCIKRMPGAFSQGAPFEGKVHNLSPRLREEIDDPDNPGYRVGIYGYWYDNLIRLTCWAKCNRGAERCVEEVEKLMEEYRWWFKTEGIDRVIFNGRDKDITKVVDNNKWHGRPLDYFVRTEKIGMISEKAIEEILVDLTLASE